MNGGPTHIWMLSNVREHFAYRSKAFAVCAWPRRVRVCAPTTNFAALAASTLVVLGGVRQLDGAILDVHHVEQHLVPATVIAAMLRVVLVAIPAATLLGLYVVLLVTEILLLVLAATGANMLRRILMAAMHLAPGVILLHVLFIAVMLVVVAGVFATMPLLVTAAALAVKALFTTGGRHAQPA